MIAMLSGESDSLPVQLSVWDNRLGIGDIFVVVVSGVGFSGWHEQLGAVPPSMNDPGEEASSEWDVSLDGGLDSVLSEALRSIGPRYTLLENARSFAQSIDDALVEFVEISGVADFIRHVEE